MMDDMELSPTCSDFSSSPTPSFSTSHPPSPISCTTSSISASTSFTTFPNYSSSQPQHVVTSPIVAAPTTPKNKFCESASRIDGREGGHKRQKSFRAQQIHSPRSSPSSNNSNSVSINSISVSFGQVGTRASPSPPPVPSSLASGLNNGALLAGTAKLIQSVPGQGAHTSNVRQMSPILQANAAASIPPGGNVVKATANLLMAQGGVPLLPISNIEGRPRRSTTPPPPPPPPQSSSVAAISPPPIASSISKESVIVTVHMPQTARESSTSDLMVEPSITRQRSRKNSMSISKKSGSQTAREPVKKKKVKKTTPDQDEASLMASLIASGLMTGGGGGGGNLFGSPQPESPVEEKGPQNNYIDSAYELPFTPPAPRPFVSFVPENATKVTSSWLKSMVKPHLTPQAIVKNTLGNTTLLEGPLSPRHSPIVVPRAASMIVVPTNGAKSPTLVSNLSNSSSPNVSPLLLPQNPASVLNSELRQVISGHSAGYLLFLRHLQREYASESLMFWKAIEDFLPLAAKHLSSELERLQQQNASASPNPASASDPSVYGPGFGTIYLTLYDMFIKTGSKMEINISSHLRELLKKDAMQHQKIRAEQLGAVDISATTAPPPPGPSPRTSPIPFPTVASPIPTMTMTTTPPSSSASVAAPGSRSNSTEVPPPPPPPLPKSNFNSPDSSTKSLSSMLAPPSPASGVALPAPLTPPPPIPPRPSKVGLNLNHISIVKDEVAQMEGATLVQNPLVCNSAPSAPVTAAVPSASNGSKYSTLPVNWMQGQPVSRSHGHQPSVTEMIHLDEMKLDGPVARRGSVPCQSASGAASPVMPPLHLPPRIALSLSTYTHLFDAQVEIEKLLTHDCLPRFKQTPLYDRWKRLDALAAASTKESNSGSTTSRISGRLSWLH